MSSAKQTNIGQSSFYKNLTAEEAFESSGKLIGRVQGQSPVLFSLVTKALSSLRQQIRIQSLSNSHERLSKVKACMESMAISMALALVSGLDPRHKHVKIIDILRQFVGKQKASSSNAQDIDLKVLLDMCTTKIAQMEISRSSTLEFNEEIEIRAAKIAADIVTFRSHETMVMPSTAAEAVLRLLGRLTEHGFASANLASHTYAKRVLSYLVNNQVVEMSRKLNQDVESCGTGSRHVLSAAFDNYVVVTR